MHDRAETHLHILERISQTIGAGRPAAGLAQSAVDELEVSERYEHGAVLLLDRDSGRLDPLALAKPGGDLGRWAADFDHVRRHAPRSGQGITGWVAAHGRSVLVADVQTDERYSALRHGVRSELCVPIRRGDSVLGVLNVESPQAAAYDDTDRRLLEIVAAQLALAVEGRAEPTGLCDELPTVCSYCRRLRLDADDWRNFESFFAERAGLLFSHGICGDCLRDLS